MIFWLNFCAIVVVIAASIYGDPDKWFPLMSMSIAAIWLNTEGSLHIMGYNAISEDAF